MQARMHLNFISLLPLGYWRLRKSQG